MKQVTSKSTLAWFKLAEFVERGERERALGIYRLLMHTIDDAAFAKQLEGDLLLNFTESEAIESYLAAAVMYHKNQQLPQAVAIYEYLVLTFPDQLIFLQTLCALYQELHHPTRIALSLDRMLEPLCNAGQCAEFTAAIDTLQDVMQPEDVKKLRTRLATRE